MIRKTILFAALLLGLQSTNSTACEESFKKSERVHFSDAIRGIRLSGSQEALLSVRAAGLGQDDQQRLIQILTALESTAGLFIEALLALPMDVNRAYIRFISTGEDVDGKIATLIEQNNYAHQGFELAKAALAYKGWADISGTDQDKKHMTAHMLRALLMERQPPFHSRVIYRIYAMLRPYIEHARGSQFWVESEESLRPLRQIIDYIEKEDFDALSKFFVNQINPDGTSAFTMVIQYEMRKKVATIELKYRRKPAGGFEVVEFDLYPEKDLNTIRGGDRK